MKETNIIRKIIKNELNRINLMEWESGYYPPGAESDPNAPWNQGTDPEITKVVINYDTQKFAVNFDNGNSFEIDFIDFLDDYWKSHKGSYEQHEAMFGADEDTMDVNVVKYLKDQGVKFSDYLADVAGHKMYDQ